MALEQTVDLEVVVDDTASPQLYSRWVAAHNPMYLEWTRKDKLVTGTDDWDGLKIAFYVADASGYTSGDLIFVSTEWITGIFTIDSIVLSSIPFPGDKIVTTTLSDSLIPGGQYIFPGYVNNLTTRKNYYIEIEILSADESTQLALLQATPDTSGKIGIDISGALQSYLSNEDPIDNFLIAAQIDSNSTRSFKYRVKEYWLNSNNSFGSASDLNVAVNGAFQIAHEQNGNYSAYYPDISNNTDAKFLTDFDELTVWGGYDIDISFVYPDSLLNTMTNAIDGFAKYYTYNDQLLHSDSFYGFILDFDENNIIRWKIPVLNSYSTVLCKYMEITLLNGLNQVIEEKRCNIVKLEDTPCPGIYLQWLGEKGNRSYFLFNDLYNESMQVEGGGTYQKSFDRIDTLTEISDWFNKDAYKKLQLGAQNLTRIEIEGIKTLLKSPKVFVVDPATFKKVGVLLEPGSFNIGRGNDDRFTIEFTIVYPKQFGQSA